MRFLNIYLNDHYAASVAGARLVHRRAVGARGSPDAAWLSELETEIRADRLSLRQIMIALNVPVRRYKIWLSALAEKVSRVKPNGGLFKPSPMSALAELEGLLLAVEGKAAGWRLLGEIAKNDPRLNVEELDKLHRRAQRQAEALERARLRIGEAVLGEGEIRGADGRWYRGAGAPRTRWRSIAGS